VLGADGTAPGTGDAARAAVGASGVEAVALGAVAVALLAGGAAARFWSGSQRFAVTHRSPGSQSAVLVQARETTSVMRSPVPRFCCTHRALSRQVQPGSQARGSHQSPAWQYASSAAVDVQNEPTGQSLAGGGSQ
jgi:hypothetical protein